jgi:hypothetical protein
MGASARRVGKQGEMESPGGWARGGARGRAQAAQEWQPLWAGWAGLGSGMVYGIAKLGCPH